MNLRKLLNPCLLGLTFLGIVCAKPTVKAAPNITDFSLGGGGERRVLFNGSSAYYYVLLRGNELTNVTSPAVILAGSNGTLNLADVSPQIDMGFYRVMQVDTNSPLDLDGDGLDDWQELQNHTDPLVPNYSLVINEVDYDNPGNDTTEFVEIYNPRTNAVNVTGLQLVLVNGANNLEYFRKPLSGVIPPLGYLVVGSTNLTLPSGAAFLPLNVSVNDIQNGAPDGLLLYQPTYQLVVDAFSYEGAINAAVVTGAPSVINLVEGTVLNPTVQDSNTVNGSLCRVPNGTDTNDANSDWVFSSTPTPGTANVP